MSSARKQYKIYGPGHFKYTWEKYLEICARDGTNASREIRRFVEGEVAKRDPGNPQRTLGTFVEGHVDEQAAKRSDMLKSFIARAEANNGEIKKRYIIKAYKDKPIPGWRRVIIIESMIKDLKLLGVTIVY